ncbi:hypothetical protein A0J61_07438 [Choanephora cucurbitarum]|uniref:RRM domain-containing protein n=1 Tax=Choanephora cucurbitarum TaxID=101091 RepID=A0A1C7N7D2_9FUNG|nr:hypothetical protein A0J61_07438 [Choanephora cucurbitarum]
MAPAAVKSKKAPVKKTPTKKTQKPAPVAASDAGSKRKRVSFDTKETTNAKKSKKQPVKEESSEDELEIPKEDDNEELTEEQEEALRKEILGDIASSSEGEDSSDDEDGIDKNDGLVTLDGKKLEQSKAETKDAFEKKKNKSNKAQEKEEKGVVYLGRIPHGFYEKEMRGYFSQFGDITRLRLSRNKKTGKPKHYGFIEFQSSQVAEIVAETMNNYLLFGHMLKCQVIPAEKVHEKLFNGSDKVYKPFNYELRNRQIHNKKLSAEELSDKCDKLKQTEEKLRKAIEDAGIDYDFPGFS